MFLLTGSKDSWFPLQSGNYKSDVSLFTDPCLHIILFPCLKFGSQEPGTNSEIKNFAANYNVKFDMFSKIDVNGDNAHPLWKYLKKKQGGTLTE